MLCRIDSPSPSSLRPVPLRVAFFLWWCDSDCFLTQISAYNTCIIVGRLVLRLNTMLHIVLPGLRNIRTEMKQTGKGLSSVMSALSRRVKILGGFLSFARRLRSTTETVSMESPRVLG